MVGSFRSSLPARLLALALVVVAGCSQAQNAELPPVLKALEAQGLEVMQEFPVEGPQRGFAAVAGEQPLAVYVNADGTAIVGTRVDATGKNLDEATLNELVVKPMQERAWAALEASAWVRDGRETAPRVVYVFSDPNCPYCNRFWQSARPWVDAGKVQLRHVLVGVIREDSAAKAAAILSAKDPSAALLENETKFANGGITALTDIPAKARQQLHENQELMSSLGFRGTPSIVVHDEDGMLNTYGGMPQDDQLLEVLGPR